MVQIAADTEDLYRTAGAEFARQAREAVRARGSFTVCLSGGSTPKGLYSLLASHPALRAYIPWESIHFFWSDERHVPPNHPESNFRMAQESLLSRVPVPAANVHRIRSECADAGQAADEYAQVLRDLFRLGDQEFPRFDLVFLGLGLDGHTASLFPGTKALSEEHRLVVSNWVEKLNTERITITVPVLNNAACVIFLVHGEEKAFTLKAVLEGSHEPEQLPAQLIRPVNGKLLWLLDRTAGRLLAQP